MFYLVLFFESLKALKEAGKMPHDMVRDYVVPVHLFEDKPSLHYAYVIQRPRIGLVPDSLDAFHMPAQARFFSKGAVTVTTDPVLANVLVAKNFDKEVYERAALGVLRKHPPVWTGGLHSTLFDHLLESEAHARGDYDLQNYMAELDKGNVN